MDSTSSIQALTMGDPEQDGDSRLFQTLFEQEFAYVWNVLRRLGVRPADREDLAQEVFVRVHQALPGYDATRPRGRGCSRLPSGSHRTSCG
jgi:RNA polymerase sigma-70 factor (ECF subfamily)